MKIPVGTVAGWLGQAGKRVAGYFGKKFEMTAAHYSSIMPRYAIGKAILSGMIAAAFTTIGLEVLASSIGGWVVEFSPVWAIFEFFVHMSLLRTGVTVMIGVRVGIAAFRWSIKTMGIVMTGTS